MDEPRVWAISYLAARGDAPWRWADHGDVVVWSDGTTIAFREEIAYVLEWLVPHGWPPFGSLVWLFAACRGKLPPRLALEEQPALTPGDVEPSVQNPGEGHHSEFRARLRSMHAAVESGLAAVSQLPPELRSPLKGKAALAEIVFGGMPKSAEKGALLSAVVEALRSGVLTDAMLNDPAAPPPERRDEWAVLHQGLRDVTPASLALRVRTGLDELPGAAELPPVASEQVRALLAELRTDRELAGLARMARDFMAALQLPRRLSEPDELPIGGFADLTNRGNLDRLLLSELAHDDLTLAVRIALNEALYLRREPPVKQPPSALAILIDSGVRLWGVPRLLAAAVALALAAKSSRHETLSVFRASGNDVQPVNLLDRLGLIAHLEALEAEAHPGAALQAFSAIVNEQEGGEAVLITQREVLADAQFQQLLAQAGFTSLYLAVVDRDGSFELLRYPRGGAPISQAQVNIEDLWPAPSSTTLLTRRQQLIDPEIAGQLPASLSRDPFPLLLAVRGKVQAAVSAASGGGLCVMQDRRLLKWERVDRGARTLAWSLPRGRTMWLSELPDGRICVIKANSGCRQLACRVFLPSGDLVSSHDWSFLQPVRRVHVQGEMVFAMCLLEATAWRLDTGEQAGTLAISNGPSHGIYFRGGADSWVMLAWDGLALGLVPVTFPTTMPAGRILRVFNREGFEGPWCITRDGDIYSHEGQIALRLGPLQNVARVSENGHRLLVAEAVGRVTRLVDLPTNTHRVITGIVRDADWEWKPSPPTCAVRSKLDRIAISGDGRLFLRSCSGKWWELSLVDSSQPAKPVWMQTDVRPSNVVPFEIMRVPGGHGYSLKLARWPGGRCAWLDDRGMLHLRCEDSARPEMTLTLSDKVSAWFSDGRWYGSSFFVGDHSRIEIREVWNRVNAFCQPVPVFPSVKP